MKAVVVVVVIVGCSPGPHCCSPSARSPRIVHLSAVLSCVSLATHAQLCVDLDLCSCGQAKSSLRCPPATALSSSCCLFTNWSRLSFCRSCVWHTLLHAQSPSYLTLAVLANPTCMHARSLARSPYAPPSSLPLAVKHASEPCSVSSHVSQLANSCHDLR